MDNQENFRIEAPGADNSELLKMEEGVKKSGSLNIPLPPEYIFEYRSDTITNRDRKEPFKAVMGGEKSSFLFTGWVFMPDGGIATSTVGTKYPSRGCVFPQALYAANAVKRMTRSFFYLFSKDMIFPALGFFISPKKYKKGMLNRILSAYSNSTIMIIENFIMLDKYCTPIVRELRKIMVNIFVSLGADREIADMAVKIFLQASIEWDNAYRWRTQDIFNETTKDKILKDPRKELKRLIDIFAVRELRGQEGSQTLQTYNSAYKIIKFFLYIPSFKKAFVSAIKESTFSNLQLDINDKYYLYLFDDYDYMGMKCADRIELFKAEHPDGKFPPRLFYQLK